MNHELEQEEQRVLRLRLAASREMIRSLALLLLWSLSLLAAAAPLPRLFPDYIDITIPPNIAPLNFKILEPAQAYRVEIRSTRGSSILLATKAPAVRIPQKAWANLLRSNAGEPLYCSISAQTNSAGWTQFGTVTNFIAREAIDGWLGYRLLKPIYNYYTHLGIYQRNLETFEQRLIIQQDSYNDSCLNCHTPLNRSPETFAFHIRTDAGVNPMILVVSNQPANVAKAMGYLAWHPSGRVLAFSANKLSLLLHTRAEAREVYDANSGLGIYRLDSNTFVFPPAIASAERNETWPAWSPDGRFLYFSSAAPQPVEKLPLIRYDLMRARFDLESGEWGKPEVVISAAEKGGSFGQPKISPDGRWLVVTACGDGSFPIFKSDSDLYVMDLASGEMRRPEINSDQADTWHSWSGNSRWLVFSSKRIDQLLARPHFTYVDERGQFHKPFVLPQEDPSFYGFCLDTFNVPEFMHGPVTVKPRALARTVVEPREFVVPKPADGPSAPASQPNQSESGYRQVRE
jgi:hypothetical protein